MLRHAYRLSFNFLCQSSTVVEGGLLIGKMNYGGLSHQGMGHLKMDHSGMDHGSCSMNVSK